MICISFGICMQTFERNRFKVSTTTNNYNDVGLNNLQVVKNAIHTLISDVQMQKMVTQKNETCGRKDANDFHLRHLKFIHSFFGLALLKIN